MTLEEELEKYKGKLEKYKKYVESIEIKTAKELKENYERDLKELQNECKHKSISDWCDFMWAPAHFGIFQIKSCNTCWKNLEWKTNCPSCKKEIILSDEEYKNLSYRNKDESALKQGYCNKECFEKSLEDLEIIGRFGDS